MGALFAIMFAYTRSARQLAVISLASSSPFLQWVCFFMYLSCDATTCAACFLCVLPFLCVFPFLCVLPLLVAGLLGAGFWVKVQPFWHALGLC